VVQTQKIHPEGILCYKLKIWTCFDASTLKAGDCFLKMIKPRNQTKVIAEKKKKIHFSMNSNQREGFEDEQLLKEEKVPHQSFVF